MSQVSLVRKYSSPLGSAIGVDPFDKCDAFRGIEKVPQNKQFQGRGRDPLDTCVHQQM